jgi:hypothetical protein
MGKNLQIDLNFWVQIVLLAAMFLYSLYSLLVFKQVKILNEAIRIPRSGLLNSLAFIHLIASVAIFIGLVLVALV